jgi:hypothetical protein
MKHAALLFFAIMLASPLVDAQEDPCAGVTCSDAGTCAVAEDGSARCTCNEGYVPDGTGLSCLAVVAATPVAPPPEAAAAPKTCPTAEEVLLQVNKGRAIKQLVVWPIFFAAGTALLIAGAVMFDRDSKLWPLHLALMVTGGFIAAASALIVAIYAVKITRINRRLRECRGIACIDFADDVELAFHPTGLSLNF